MNVQIFVCRRGLPQSETRLRGRPAIGLEQSATIQERTNLDCTVRFLLDGQEFERRVTRQPDDPARDVNVESPVGRALLVADVGDEVNVETPGGYVVVKVLDTR